MIQKCDRITDIVVHVLLFHYSGLLPVLPIIPLLPVFITYNTVFLISSYGAPLAQRASYLVLHSSLFGPVAHLTMIMIYSNLRSAYVGEG